MLRRSAPVLLGVFVCLLAAHLSSAAPTFRLDESRIRLSLDGRQARVRLEVENGTGRDFTARLRVELLDPHDRVRATTTNNVGLRRGSNAPEVALDFNYAQLIPAERQEFPWYRLRYSVEPDAVEGGPAALGGVVSVSEVTPDLFELTVISAPAAHPGSHYGARVRTANPATERPLKGVAVEATLTFEDTDDKKIVLKSSGTTDGDGVVALDFDVPRTMHDDEAELKVTAGRGAFVEQAETEVSVEEKPRVLLTTDKPLYQPGQTVHMRALVFDQSGRALAGEEVTFKVEDEEDTAAFTEGLKTSRFGVAAADWRVPESTKLGTYKLKLVMDDDRYDIDYGARMDFRVSRYDLPNFSVAAKADRPYYLKGENPSVEVRADYLFGQPVKRGRVRVVRQTERRWNYKEQKYETEEHPAVEGELHEGLYTARLDLGEEHEELAGSGWERLRDLEFVAYVTDPTTNHTEQRRFAVRLTKEPVHLYVSEGRFRQAKGLPLAFYLATFYADGTPAECDVTIYEGGATTRTLGADGRVHEVKDADRAVANVRTNRYGVAKVSGPSVRRDEERQNLPLRFVARDRAGREGHHGEDFWLDFNYNAPEVRVETDKTVYAAGEPVRVELSSAAEQMGVVVDAVSEGRVLSTRLAKLSGGRAALVIPTDPSFAGPVTVTATSVAPMQDGDAESFSLGARTVVFPRDRELKLDVKLSQKSFRPGGEATAQFAVRTADGRRAAGALGVVVFDKAVEERARTDGEAGRGFGFAGSFYDYWYGSWNVAGVTRRDVERLDPARTLPEGFDTVAELLYNNDRPEDFHRVTTGTDFDSEQSRVFADLVKARLKPLSDVLSAHYLNAAEYPADEAALLRTLAGGGVEFAALRDPWGQPFRPRFSFERQKDRLELLSSGADERPGTEDDFVAQTFDWPYFRKTGEALNRAAADYHTRTGGYVRDTATLLAELRRAGVGDDALRDRWGQPYRFHFETSGPHFVVSVESAGPDRIFAARGSYSDDFDVWNLLTDYYEESRKALDAALNKNMREGRGFPRTSAELTSALAKSSLSLEALRDGWGHAPYPTFSKTSQYADRLAVLGHGPADAKLTVQPVTQLVYTLSLRSTGPDGRIGTPDDFTLAYFTSVGEEQAAQDAAPVPVSSPMTFSGGTGAISGTVTDPQGAVIPGATVVARHNFADFEISAQTNDEGAYLLRNLPSGVYKVTITAAGFLTWQVDSVRVVSSSLTKVDAALNVGGTQETVTVTAGDDSTNTLNQTSASVSKTVTVGRPYGPQAPLSTPRLRQFFPETLVWSPELETARDGTARLNFKLADNITTWKMSVIASTEDGRLGMAETELLSFQPFFVEHDPPRVLTEGDEISLPVVLRNYLAKAQGVDVEMKPESWFALGGAARQRAEVPAGDAARTTFDFRAVASVTDGKQRVTALGGEASDAIEKPVTVHPDGEERSVTDGAFLRDTGALAVNVPGDVVRGSMRGELKVYPSLTAHVLEGVEAIMARPYGCGEQTISSSYPSVLVLNFHAGLKGDGGVEPETVARARKYARLGYERLLGYRAPGGGFTYWGRGEADVALSAYALRFLTDAARVIEVDAGVMAETRDWLLRQQQPDGRWPAHVWYRDEEDTRRTALTTAFVARVLAATQKSEPAARGPLAQGAPAPTPPTQTTPAGAAKEQPAPLKRALAYVAARADETGEPYLIASLALAAADAGEPALVERAAARLRALALPEGTGTYWALETNTPFYGWGLAGRVETTALAVQALSRYCATPNADCGQTSELVDRGLQFLLKKKDRYGVWYSTQATVNVFDALLSAVAAHGGGAAPPAEDVAEVFVNGRRAGQLTLPPADRLSGPLLLDLTPQLGVGANRVELCRRAPAALAQAQLVTTFYVPWGARSSSAAGAESAEGGPDATKRSAASELKLSVGYDHADAGVSQEVTCSVSAERVGHRGYGMLLAEVGLPPGADVDRASLERAMAESDWGLSSYDVLPDRLVVYLWPRGGGTRFQFKFRPRYGLNALTAPSQLYDYYNPEARTVVAPTRFVVR